MGKIKLDYGKKGLYINLENADVYYPTEQNALENPQDLIYAKLCKPDFGKGLKELLKGKKTVAIAHTDITRATPNHIIIPVIIKSLLLEGVKKQDITLVNMTGSHRPETKEELAVMLGRDIVTDFKCVQHNCFDKSTLALAG
jgi:nickel-dependent lactate racemase